jgi:regulator of protease activity HflC (stomatin/prohibitin superfamily)
MCLAAAGLSGVFWIRSLFPRVIVETEFVGLLYRNGVFVRTLSPGAYRIVRGRNRIERVDLRKALLVVAGQEVLTKDKVGLKVTAVVTYQVSVPDEAMHRVQSYPEALYTATQLSLRAAVSRADAEEILERQVELAEMVRAMVADESESFGVECLGVSFRDFMFSGDLKRAFNEVLKARKEGQAALERARGEHAALRSMANAARLLDQNPALMTLRVLKTVADVGAVQGNTLVLGVPPSLVDVQSEKGGKLE